MKDIFEQLPPDLFKFVLVTVFSLLIGLEQRRRSLDRAPESIFGTDRTFTLIGIAGFILYIISPQNLIPFAVGGIVIGGLLALYYYQKMKAHQLFGMTSLITALITYCLGPFVCTQNRALVLLLVVIVLVVTEVKESLRKLTAQFGNDEFISLAKFIVLAGIILPLLPDAPISDIINVSPYKCWLAIVVVSSISYFSYLLRKFVFPDTGILLTGILGGLYSSTSTTVILARKSKEDVAGNRIIGAMFLALTMMYLRIFLLALFFNPDIAMKLLPDFAGLTLISLLIAVYFIKIKKTVVTKQNEALATSVHQNPLEFKTALLFGGLFIVFAIVTQFVIKNYGGHGVSVLAYIVGVTDVDPFIINLFQGKMVIDSSIITIAVLNATTSNNLLKMMYAVSLGDKSLRKELFVSFGILIVAGIVAVLI
ncbi:MAG TPA: DUF4010 domain-containing protein [Bacteroidia bacterium]|jgi:uncharacterized membrane protein (DUF4010 family)|nr:DUF4010 domain-containing protein [Bacteroidia bacterium]